MNAPWEHEWQDYYETLQVSPRAETDVIVAAYRRLAKKYHPDLVSSGDLERMKRINVANDVLCDPSARASYDVAWRERTTSPSAVEEQLRQARDRERRARAASEQARREAREAQAAADRSQDEAKHAREELERTRRESASSRRSQSSFSWHSEAAADASDAPASAGGSDSGINWLDLVSRAARAVIAVRLSGIWRSPDGLTYTLQHDGGQLAFQATNLFGFVVSTGGGSVMGRHMELQYRLADGTSGVAAAEVSPDGQRIQGTATNFFTGLTVPVILSR
jgi:DnaJ domain